MCTNLHSQDVLYESLSLLNRDVSILQQLRWAVHVHVHLTHQSPLPPAVGCLSQYYAAVAVYGAEVYGCRCTTSQCSILHTAQLTTVDSKIK